MTEPQDPTTVSFEAFGPGGFQAEGVIDTETGEAVVMGEALPPGLTEFLAMINQNPRPTDG